MLMRDDRRRQLGAGGRVHRRRHAPLRPRRPLGLPGAARRRPLLRHERARAERLYDSAELIINLHGGTAAAARARRDRAGSSTWRPTRCSCSSSCAHERAGDARLPRAALRLLHLRRELGHARLRAAAARTASASSRRASRSCSTSGRTAARSAATVFTTVGNWRQRWRDVTFEGERYTWSKHHEFRKFLDLPARTGSRLRAGAERATSADGPRAAASARLAGARRRSTSRPRSTPTATTSAARAASSPSPRTRTSRLRTGWFSDRSATYLAAGRPVITPGHRLRRRAADRRGPVRLRDARRGGRRGRARSTPTTRATRARPRDRRASTSRTTSCCGALLDAPAASRRRAGARAPARSPTTCPPTCRSTPLSRRPTRAAARDRRGGPVPVAPGCRDAPPRRGGRPAPASSSSPTTASPSPASASRACSPTRTAPRLRADRRRQRLRATAPRELPDAGSRGATRSVRVLLNGDNRGFAAGLQPGPRRSARGEHLVLLNNDTMVPPGWLARLVGAPAQPERRAGRARSPTGSATRPRSRPTTAPGASFLGGRRAARRASTPASWLRAADAGDVLPRDAPRDLRPPRPARRALRGRAARGRRLRRARARRPATGCVCAEDVARAPLRRGARSASSSPTATHGALLRANQRALRGEVGHAVAALRPPAQSGATSASARAHPRGGRRGASPRARRCSWSAAATSVLRSPVGPRAALPAGGGRRLGRPPPGRQRRGDRAARGAARAAAPGFLLPQTSLWWLEHYGELGEHLERALPEVVRDDACVVFSLEEAT